MRDVALDSVPGLPSLYRSAILGAIPVPWSSGAVQRGPGGTAAALPDVRHHASDVQATIGELTRFQQLIGAPAQDVLPSGYLHTIAFPVAMSVMARKDFPLPLLGMIHLRNAVEHRRAVGFDERLDIAAWAEDLLPHHAGTQVDLVTQVSSSGAVVWTGRSTYLAKGTRIAGPATGAKEERTPFAAPSLTAVWNLPGSIGRSYAAVSGDYNPIHLSAPTAKALGMQRAIAHGMYFASRMVQETKPAGVDSFSWSIDFRSPVLLPAKVAIAVAPQSEAGVWQGASVTGWNQRRGREHFVGSLARLAEVHP